MKDISVICTADSDIQATDMVAQRSVNLPEGMDEDFRGLQKEYDKGQLSYSEYRSQWRGLEETAADLL
jgi:hypothetical protein